MSIKLLDTIYKLTDNADKVDGYHFTDLCSNCPHHSISSSDTSCWYKLITIDVIATGWGDLFYEFEITGRASGNWGRIRIWTITHNSNKLFGVEPKVTYDGTLGGKFKAYRYTVDNVDKFELWMSLGTWEVWNFYVRTYEKETSYMTLTWNKEKFTAAPTGFTKEITIGKQDIAGSASKLATARTISLTGSVTGSGTFDGSANLSIATTTNHTHSYAGSSSAGGAATSANKLNTNAGSSTNPVYFSGGVPVACTYSLNATVPSGAKFTDTTYGANNGVGLSGTTFYNTGVRSVATGTANGTISVNTNGTAADVSVKGLGTAAYTASSDYAAAGHKHGLLHTDLSKQIENTTTDSGWSMINSTYSGYILKSLRTQANAPSWIENNYAAGICFGGADTKGVLSCAYNAPYIKFAGGNSTKPVWYIRLTGTSGTSYDLNSMPYAKSAGNADTVDNKHASDFATSGHTHNYAGSSSAGGSATSADKLTTARTISLTGAVTGSGSFNGSANLSIATTVNHNHNSSYVTALGTSGNYLTWTKNGTTNNITVPYASSAASAGNADTLDSYHASSFVTVTNRQSLYTSGTAPYAYVYLFRIANTSGYSTTRCDFDIKLRNNRIKFFIDIVANQYPYGSSGSYGTSISIYKETKTGNSLSIYYVPTVAESGYNYYDVYCKMGSWQSGQFDLVSSGGSGTLFYEIKKTYLDSLPEGAIEIGDCYYNKASVASKLETARTISLTGAVTGSGSFNGSANLSIATTVNHTHNYAGSSSAGGAATSANKLTTARTISLTGSVTGSGSFDGSGNLSIATTTNHTHSYAASSHTHNYAGSSSPGGAATSALTISASAPQLAAAGESNNINIVNNANSSITTNSPENLAAITKAIRFRWYDDYWEIGSIRGSSNKSVGFGFTINNSNLRFRITSDAAYVGSSIVLHAGNWSSYCAAKSHTHDYAASSHTHNYAGSSSAGGAANSANKLNLVSSGITSTSNDTTAKWGPLGSSIHFVTTTGQLINQPSQYGMIINLTNGSAEVAQLWFTQNTGTLYHRQGNSAGWGCNWTAILDSSNYSTWAAAKSHTHNYAGSSSAGGKANDSDKVDGYHISVVSSAGSDSSTIYFIV